MNAASTSLKAWPRQGPAAIVSKTGWVCHVSGYLDALSRGIRKNGDRRM